METTNLYIYGASGHGKVVLDIARRMGYKILGFIDDDENKKELLGFPVYSFDKIGGNNITIALGIGENRARELICEKIKKKNMKIATLIDPSSIVSEYAIIKEGSVIFPNAVVNSSAVVGRGCIVNSGAIVEHDCIIGDFSHISPNAALAGGVKVGRYTQIGIGACVKQNVVIEDNVIVGAGAVIVKDIPKNSIAIGNPGRIRKFNE